MPKQQNTAPVWQFQEEKALCLLRLQSVFYEIPMCPYIYGMYCLQMIARSLEDSKRQNPAGRSAYQLLLAMMLK